YRGPVLIHASKGMTLDEYRDVAAFVNAVGIGLPQPAMLDRGGIVGQVEIVDCVQSSASPWFFGSYGFVLRNPKVLPFRPLKGRLGFFDVPAIPSLDAQSPGTPLRGR